MPVPVTRRTLVKNTLITGLMAGAPALGKAGGKPANAKGIGDARVRARGGRPNDSTGACHNANGQWVRAR